MATAFICEEYPRTLVRGACGKKRYPNRRFSKTCIVCATQFETQNLPTSTCGRVCGKVLSDRSRSENAALRKQRTCERCGKGFIQGSRSAKQTALGEQPGGG